MSRILPLVLGIVVIAVGTYFQGKQSDRWNQDFSQRLITYGQRVPHVPLVIGDWTCIEEQELDEAEWAATNCVKYISRVYQNSDGQTVSMYLVAGSGRHITIHSPDQCFVGAGYEMEERPRPCDVDLGENRKAQFATSRFLREDSTKREHIRILWSYSDDGQWEGPSWAKSEYGALDAMYKVYLISNIDELNGTGVPHESASASFARELMPLLSDILFTEGAETMPNPEAPSSEAPAE